MRPYRDSSDEGNCAVNSPDGDVLRVSTFRPRTFAPASLRKRGNGTDLRSCDFGVDQTIQQVDALTAVGVDASRIYTDKLSGTSTREQRPGLAALLELAELMVGKSREDLVCVRRLVATFADFPRVTPHDLRHTAASLAISGGANPKAVQTMLGHQSAVLTMDT